MEDLTFEFGKATEVTKYALENFGEYNEYERIFLTPDTRCWHVLRVLPGVGHDYEPADGMYILEEAQIHRNKGDKINHRTARAALVEDHDDLSNWDYGVFSAIEAVIDEVDGGFGIHNLEQ